MTLAHKTAQDHIRQEPQELDGAGLRFGHTEDGTGGSGASQLNCAEGTVCTVAASAGAAAAILFRGNAELPCS